jgi:hypothetical protein
MWNTFNEKSILLKEMLVYCCVEQNKGREKRAKEKLIFEQRDQLIQK